MLCKRSDLTNEASVETWFTNKLLAYLGYTSDDIRLKTSLKEYKIGRGSKSELYARAILRQPQPDPKPHSE